MINYIKSYIFKMQYDEKKLFINEIMALYKRKNIKK